MEYWDIARKQFTAGMDERIEADKKYLEAKEDYEKEKLQLDEDYNDKREKLEKELNETIQELEEKRDSAIADRKKDILSSMITMMPGCFRIYCRSSDLQYEYPG